MDKPTTGKYESGEPFVVAELPLDTMNGVEAKYDGTPDVFVKIARKYWSYLGRPEHIEVVVRPRAEP